MTFQKRFTSTEGVIFTVQEVVQVNKELWVYYTKAETGEKYSCLLEAFTKRFQEIQND